MGGGYPPLPWLKNLLKIGPKTVFFRQKTPFLAKKFQAACRDGGGGGTPLCSDFFPVNFLAGRLPWCRDGGRGGGGYPHHGKKPWLAFLNPSLIMRWWCAFNALLMRFWCAYDALMMQWWCTDDRLLSFEFQLARSLSVYDYDALMIFWTWLTASHRTAENTQTYILYRRTAWI